MLFRKVIPMMLLLSTMSTLSVAQQDSIYTIVEQMPRFPGCENITGTERQKDSCAQKYLMEYVYRQVRYPEEARRNGNEGTAVIGFVVEKDGRIGDVKIVKDLAGGCGAEALRVINAMNDYGFRWSVGKNNGDPVRVRMNIPVRFRLAEQPPFNIINGDSVYYEPEVLADFKGGDTAIIAHMQRKLKYPSSYKDSCKVGSIDVTLLLRPNGTVTVTDLIDYSNLGYDFWYEAIAFSHSTEGKWDIAQYQGKPVTSSYPLRLTFRADQCPSVVANFDKARKIAEEAMVLNDASKLEEAATKLTEAINMIPQDMELRYMRGMIYLNNNKFTEACQDLSEVKRRVIITWFENILPIICK